MASPLSTLHLALPLCHYMALPHPIVSLHSCHFSVVRHEDNSRTMSGHPFIVLACPITSRQMTFPPPRSRTHRIPLPIIGIWVDLSHNLDCTCLCAYAVPFREAILIWRKVSTGIVSNREGFGAGMIQFNAPRTLVRQKIVAAYVLS